ncbi:blood plasma glutamate carboxypeptidase [Asticcacaulis biprosthecium C19]|uniref:Carboxypeptidase Q n=1 Tax=Asticcacaulis biprosthecium C19 TaxID=715226 RepID=F4QRM1_9CAUL|nr:M20/M25/M40 family metallo-hydrolase [Asticcacaulis biprosthecium]EGF90147.1 blood plasma glutamate carboxypeptidase [Asticcacaulis biprosthecium C19]
MKPIHFAAVLAAGLAVAAPPVLHAKPKKAVPAAPAAIAPADQAVVLRDAALKDNNAYEFVAELTTRFGARPAGSASEKAAAEWSAAQFKAMGFDKVRIETFPLEIWQRGDESLEMVGPFPQKLVATALGGSGTTPAEGVEAEAALFETYEQFSSSTADLKGKIVVILQPTVATQTGVGYGANSGSVRRQGPEIARQRGAVGYLMRSLGTHDHRFAHTGGTRFLGAEGVPAMAISPPDAEQFERILKLQKQGQAGPIRLKMVSTPKFLGTGQSQNVIAEITGAKRPQEIITIGGHLDSWDLGTGAIDDGAGVAITMAAAKTILDSKVRPDRTIRVVFWGSEEVSQPNDRGLSGANAYATAYKAEFPNHVIAAESDFGADVVYALSLPESDSPEFVKQVGNVLYPLGIYIDKAVSTGGGPDTSPLFSAGVPVMDLQQDGMDYFDTHHTPDDVLERIDPIKVDQNVAAWAATVWLIASTEVKFKGVAPKP